MKEKYYSYIVIAFLAVGGCIVFLTMRKDIRVEEETIKEYPVVRKDEAISGVIKNTYVPPKLRAIPDFVSCQLMDNSKFSLRVSGDAIEQKVSLRDVCKSGYLVRKKDSSDTLIVLSSDRSKKYVFLIK